MMYAQSMEFFDGDHRKLSHDQQQTLFALKQRCVNKSQGRRFSFDGSEHSHNDDFYAQGLLNEVTATEIPQRQKFVNISQGRRFSFDGLENSHNDAMYAQGLLKEVAPMETLQKQKYGYMSQGRRFTFDGLESSHNDAFYTQGLSKEFTPMDFPQKQNYGYGSQSYNDPFYGQGLSKESISMDIRPCSISLGSQSDIHRSFANRSSPTAVIAPCRQLPCRTFICTGTCPYGERCVFLHDPRIESNCPALKARLRKGKEDSSPDSFFWQTMPRREVIGKTDNGRNLPAISQHYVVPHPSSTIGLARDLRNNDAVYSLWSHFLEFLVTDPASVIHIPRWLVPLAAEEKVNKHTGKRRLDFFVAMSEGKCARSCM